MKMSKVFELSQACEVLDVMNVHGSACDNAAATMGGQFVQGEFNDEFLVHWYGSLQSSLADGDDVSQEARAFFDGLGVQY